MDINTFGSTIRDNLSQLATQLANTIPAAGDFPKVSTSTKMTYEGITYTVQVAIGAWERPTATNGIKNWREMRYLEVKVAALSGDVDSSTWLETGTNEELKLLFKNQEQLAKRISNSCIKSIQHLQRDFGMHSS